MTPQNFDFLNLFTAKVTLIIMIQKWLQLFWMSKSKVVMTYFMFVLLRPCRMTGNNFKEKKFVTLIFTQC